MQEQEIKQLVIWTHPFYTFTYFGSSQNLSLKEEELRVGLQWLRQKMERIADAIAKKPHTALVIVEPDIKQPAPGAKETYESFLEYCRKKFGERLIRMPAGVGHVGCLGTLPAIREGLKRYKFSKELRIFRLGEFRGKNYCVERANKRIVEAIREIFGITVPPKRQHEMRKFSFTEKEAKWAILSATKYHDLGLKPSRRLRHRRA